jgi:hypothetical protein
MDITSQGLHLLTLQRKPEIGFFEEVGLIINKNNITEVYSLRHTTVTIQQWQNGRY